MADDGEKEPPPGIDIEGSTVVPFNPRARDKEPPLHGEDPNAASEPFPYLDPRSLQGKEIPPREWLVPSLIPMENVTLFNGDGGTGKSLLAMQLQVAAALETDWIGYPVKKVRSLGLYCEDDGNELHRRLADILKSEDRQFDDLGEALFSVRVGQDNILAHASPNGDGTFHPTPLYHSLVDTAQELGVQLIVLDTVADCFGGNENWRADVRQFVNILRRLALDIEGAVVLTAHPSQAGLSTGSGYSGSTAWNNTVRSRLYLTRPEQDAGQEGADKTERVLKTMKSNYSGADDQILLKWIDGVFQPQKGGHLSQQIEKGVAERIFLATLEKLILAGTNVGTNPQGNYAPRVMVGMPDTQRLRKLDLELAMKRLLAAGAIGNKTYGPPSRGRTRLMILDPGERAKAQQAAELPQDRSEDFEL
jgi:hypothetical protein